MNQEVNFSYGFALRGESQVERSLDSIADRLARTSSMAGVAGIAFERVGRIFETGLPIGLMAAGAGLAIDKLSELNDQSEKVYESMMRVSTVDFRNESVKDLTSDLEKATNAVEKLQDESRFAAGAKSILGFIDGTGDDDSNALYTLNRATSNLSEKQAQELDKQTQWSRLEAYGHGDQARIDKIRDEEDEQVTELAKKGQRVTMTPVYKMLAGGWESDQITGYRRDVTQLNQAQIDAVHRSADQRVGDIHLAAFEKGNRVDAVASQEGKEKRDEAADRLAEKMGRIAELLDKSNDISHADDSPTQRIKYLQDTASGMDQNASMAFQSYDFEKALTYGNQAGETRKEIPGLQADALNQQYDSKRMAREDASYSKLGGLDTSTKAGRLTEAHAGLDMANADVSDIQAKIAQEMKMGPGLQKQVNEDQEKLHNALRAQYEAQQKVTSQVKAKEEWHRDDIVASSTRRLGGGGGVWSTHTAHPTAPFVGPPNPHAFNPGSMKNEDVLKDFSETLRGHTDTLKKQWGGTLQTVGI